MDNNDIFNLNDDNQEKPQMPFEKKYLIGVTVVAALLIIIMTLVGVYIGYAVSNKNTTIIETNPTVNITGTTASGMSVQQVTELVENTIVQITAESRGGTSRGSGVIISEDGWIITNAHVVNIATNVNSIKVALANGNEYTARSCKIDEVMDIAVIKINASEKLSRAKIGDSTKLKKGQPVVVIGHPLGTQGGSVTDGILSALDKEIIVENRPMRLLQTNAAINPGNSGGGMFDMAGVLIGIVNAKSAAVEVEGMGFAIPIKDAYEVAHDLMTIGYVEGRVDTGIYPVEVAGFLDMISKFQNTIYNNGEPGVYVYNVNTKLAEQVIRGDKVVAINGEPINNLYQYNQEIEKYKPGDKLKFTFKRGVPFDVVITLEEYRG